MSRVPGKVAFITGAARGQGRSHAVRLAEEGADILAVDICGPVDTSVSAPATLDDLEETARLVEKEGRRIVTAQVDVRDLRGLKDAVERGVAELGPLDIVLANAGMSSYAQAEALEEDAWQVAIDVNLTGVWKTVKAAAPHLNDGGSIVITSSAAGLKAYANCGHYVSAKHGVVGLMRTLALELAPRKIRVNTVHPTNVDTAMLRNEATYRMFRPDLEDPTFEDVAEGLASMNALPVSYIDPREVSNAVLFLVSDESQYITGCTLTVDAGLMVK